MSLMNGRSTQPTVTPELIAEASAWVAILHGPHRTNSTERGFSQWLKRSDSHAKAFEEATDIWEEARSLPRPRRLRTFGRTPPPSFLRRQLAVAALVLAAVGVGFFILMPDSGVSTNIGEQRVLALEDGTLVILNTQTRVVVNYDSRERRIQLKEGEALFEVAKRADWPFYVTAGDRTIRALGTSFAVRRDEDRVAVTLVEGSVTVTPTDDASAEIPPVALTPGERVVFEPSQPAKADRPQIEKLLAWQRREVALTDVALAEAVAEMNRYSREQLVAQTDTLPIRVTGLFRAGDSMSFARAVAEAYHLEVEETHGEIRLRGMPKDERK